MDPNVFKVIAELLTILSELLEKEADAVKLVIPVEISEPSS